MINHQVKDRNDLAWAIDALIDAEVEAATVELENKITSLEEELEDLRFILEGLI